MKNVAPVARFIRKPAIANGIRSRAAATGTRFMNPISRRSKKPAIPRTRVRPMKWRISHTGQIQGYWTTILDAAVDASQAANPCMIARYRYAINRPAAIAPVHNISDTTARRRGDITGGAARREVDWSRATAWRIALVMTRAAAISASFT